MTVGDSGRIFTSSDGTTWAIKNSGTTKNLHSVSYGNNQFVAVGDSGTILSSSDGTTWTIKNSGITNQLRSVTYGNNQFVAVGKSVKILTSPDGTVWTIKNSGLTDGDYFYNTLNSVTYGNGKYVAVGTSVNDIPYWYGGQSTMVLTSLDGITWTVNAASGNNGFLGEVIYGNNQFVAVGFSYNPLIQTSPDGTTWTTKSSDITSYSYNPLMSVAYGNSMFLAVGLSGIILTSKSIAINSCKATVIGNNTIEFEIQSPTSQQHVEVFVRQNGIQNVAQNIVDNVVYNNDGTVTYKLTSSGYNIGDVVEYRFYSYALNSPTEFTPGPVENSWKSVTLGTSNTAN